MCGVAGVYNVKNAQYLVGRILFAIQHRGQESCGLSTRVEDGNILTHKGMGLVNQVFTPDLLAEYSGRISIGHVRYPTAGVSNRLNSQPHSIELAQGAQMSICSNGDIVNYTELRGELETKHGFIFKSDNDGELIGRLIAFHHIVEKNSIEESIAMAQSELKGAFSAILMYRDQMFAFRDPHGYRPFVLGHLNPSNDKDLSSDGTVFASEGCSFGIVGAEEIREVLPGEIIKLESGKPIETIKLSPKKEQHCVFELIYFSRPDSSVFGEYVWDVRKKIGATLAGYDSDIEDGDDLVVISVPDSSNFVALGYAEAKGAKFDMALLRNHYVGRTFTRPDQKTRDEGVTQKFNPLPGFFAGKRVVMVDDSIVRGTTVRRIVEMVRRAGAKEIHLRIGSPKVTGPCHFGIDTPTCEELIANRMNSEKICEYLNADSLKYFEIKDFKAVLKAEEKFCLACFDGEYMYKPS